MRDPDLRSQPPAPVRHRSASLLVAARLYRERTHAVRPRTARPDDVGPRRPSRMESCHLLWHIRRLSRKPVTSARQRRDRQCRAKSRVSIAEPEFTAVQRPPRRRQTQSKTGAGLGAAGLEPYKSFHRMSAIGLRYPRPVVGDAEQHLIAVATRL